MFPGTRFGARGVGKEIESFSVNKWEGLLYTRSVTMFRKKNVPSPVRVLLGADRQTCMCWRVFATKVKLANARVFTTVFIYIDYILLDMSSHKLVS